jgi:type IV secretion system protein TrbF
MSFGDTIKSLVWKSPDSQSKDTPAVAERQHASTDNPYLNARRTWNHHVGTVVAQRQAWQVVAILSLLIALAAVGGVVHIGSQSKFLPYVVEVDKLGQTLTVGPLEATGRTDPRVVHAAIAEWLSCARLVTPDMALQRKCVFRVYSMLAPNDAATPKMNEHLNGTEDASPFKRAASEMVSIEIRTVIPQTPTTWQVEWMETTHDRQGARKGSPVTWRALVTTYVAEVTQTTTDEQLRNNPMSIYVRDYSWARVQ